jgi:pantothenate kinase type III
MGAWQLIRLATSVFFLDQMKLQCSQACKTNVVTELKYKVAYFIIVVPYMAHQINLVMQKKFAQSLVGKLDRLL